ncbi:MAG TPA: zinc ribbon domain-containing protein [Thermoanaerobaculia bacterium]|nr:zinc ribbon domain-containing protein [Thermoanaerobaculia bacterium]
MTRNCSRCSTEIDAERNLCPVCFFGEGLKADTVECAKCHTELDDDVRFCPQCGAMAPAATAAAGDPIRRALAAKLLAVEGRGIPGLAITWGLMLIYALLLSHKQGPARAPSNPLEAFAGVLTQWMIMVIATLCILLPVPRHAPAG